MYEELQKRGLKPGTEIPRTVVNALFVRGFKVGIVNVRKLIETGEAMGYWKREWDPEHSKKTNRLVLLDHSDASALQGWDE